MTEFLLKHYFDAIWYLQHHPDVAAAEVDPLQHYLEHGRFEQRWPCDLLALRLDAELWRSPVPDTILIELTNLVAAKQPLHSALAAWVLARWYGSFEQYSQVHALIDIMLSDAAALAVLANQAPFLLAFSACVGCADIKQARALLQRTDWPSSADKWLAASMLEQGAAKLNYINTMFAEKGLTGLVNNNTNTPNQLLLSSLKAALMPSGFSWPWQPLVSVIVPCYNAAATIGYALNSLCQQSWRKLQIIVVDDASTDNSVAIVQQLATKDKRITLLSQSENNGAYAVRNIGLAAARGQFITVHDSDDWSHPEKIALQLAALKHKPKAMASISYWLRCSNDLQFGHWRIEDGWVYRNTSSLLYRCEVIKTLGFWDSVSVGADTEYMHRTLQRFGEQAVVEVKPGVPLSFGLADANTLTQTKATHLRTQFRGLRYDYREAAFNWHKTADDLYLPAEQKKRPFAVPPLMCRGSEQLKAHNLMLLLTSRQLFDAPWYLQRNADVAAAGADAMQHFISHGAAEGRDPLPGFSLSAYALLHQVPLNHALVHWLMQMPPLTGPIWLKQPTEAAMPPSVLAPQHIVLVAHAAGAELFGAERSFIDVLYQLNSLNLVITVVLPSALNPAYIEQLLPLCQQLVVLPYGWWRADKAQCQQTITCFSELYSQLQPDVVYLNTSVLHEPAVAARELGLRTLIHVREIANTDAQLCRVLAATPSKIAQHSIDYANVIIANSAAVADFIACPERTVILPNTLALSLKNCPARPATARLQLGMISSNTEKKGIIDFFAMAQAAKQQQLSVDFILFGPTTNALQHLLQQHPELVQYRGYVATPEVALAQLDAVLNLSQVAESFGRTVLEALACKRLVLAYRHGALADWLAPDYAVLAELGDWQSLLEQLAAVIAKPQQLQQILEQGAAMVWQRYSHVKAEPYWQQILQLNS